MQTNENKPSMDFNKTHKIRTKNHFAHSFIKPFILVEQNVMSSIDGLCLNNVMRKFLLMISSFGKNEEEHISSKLNHFCLQINQRINKAYKKYRFLKIGGDLKFLWCTCDNKPHDLNCNKHRMYFRCFPNSSFFNITEIHTRVYNIGNQDISTF